MALSQLKYILFSLLLVISTQCLAFDFAETGYELINGKCPKTIVASTSVSALQNNPSCRAGDRNLHAISINSEILNKTAEDSFLAGLAQQRMQILDCASLQIQNLTAAGNQQKLEEFADLYTEKLIALGRAKKKMNLLSMAIATDEKAKEDYKKAKNEANIIIQGLTYSEVKSVRLMINAVVAQDDQFNPGGEPTWFRKQIKDSVIVAMKSANSYLKKDILLLNKGVQTLGTSLDDPLRESLAQDTDLVEAYRQKNKANESEMIPVVCRVDAKYGKGAQYRDNAVLAISVLGTAGSFGILGVSRLATAVTGAAARGALTVRSAQMMRLVASMTNGVSALNTIRKACLNDSTALNAKINQSLTCEPDTLKSIKTDDCVMAGTLAALNLGVSIPSLNSIWAKASSRAESVAAEVKVAATLRPNSVRITSSLVRFDKEKMDSVKWKKLSQEELEKDFPGWQGEEVIIHPDYVPKRVIKKEGYIRYTKNEADENVDEPYLKIEMLKGHPNEPSVGDYLKQKMIEENPGMPVYSTLAQRNGLEFKKAFREMEQNPELLQNPEKAAQVLGNIPAFRSSRGAITLKPIYNSSGDLQDIAVILRPDPAAESVVINNIQNLAKDEQFQKWMRSLSSRPDAYWGNRLPHLEK